MCGRFSLTEALADLQHHFAFEMRNSFHYEQKETIAPSETVTAIVQVDGIRYPASFRWGLIPPFAKDASFGYKTFNARSETVHEKPSFRQAFRTKRCIIPASSFFEWQTLSPKEKIPYRIRQTDRPFLAFAGLWESWRNNDQLIRSCTILTTSPSNEMAWLHDRMPLLLNPDDYDTWLNPDASQEQLQSIIKRTGHPSLSFEKVPSSLFKRT